MFWEVSFREYRAMMAGAAARLKRERNERAWLAWHTATLTRIKAEKYPKLESMMHGARRHSRRQSIDQQIGIARQWTAALGPKR